jgi:hypothetical protein
MEVRFKSVGALGREALRSFFRDPSAVAAEPQGQIPTDLVPYLQVQRGTHAAVRWS